MDFTTDMGAQQGIDLLNSKFNSVDTNISTINNNITNINSYMLNSWNGINGLIISNNSVTPNSKIDIGTGSWVDLVTNGLLTLSSPITGILSSPWAAGNDQNKLDTGSVQVSKTYYIYLIQNNSDSSIDILFSLSKDSPIIPTGYTSKKCIGMFLTNGSGNIIQSKWSRIANTLRCDYLTAIADRILGQVGNLNRNLINISAPRESYATINGVLYTGLSTAGNSVGLKFGATFETDVVPDQTLCNWDCLINTTGDLEYKFNNTIKSVYIDSNSQIYYKVGSESGAHVGFSTRGWTIVL